MKILKKLSVTWTLIATVSLTQISFIAVARADGSHTTDVQIYLANSGDPVNVSGLFTNAWASVCAVGADPITSITFDVDVTNVNITALVTVDEYYPWNNATDTGSFNGFVWTGVLENDQCFTINPNGTITGDDGDSAIWEASIVSSSVGGDANSDPDATNDSSSSTQDIIARANVGSIVGREGSPVLQDGADYTDFYTNLCVSPWSSSIKEITFSFTSENIDIGELSIAEWSTATDPGSISGNVWSGLMEGGECVSIFHTDTVTGEIGDTASETLSIISSVLYNDEVNVDPDNTNDSSTYSAPIIERPIVEDLSLYIDPGAYSIASGGITGIWHSICAFGYGEITTFSLNHELNNMEILQYEIAIPDQFNTATDLGSIANGVWTGRLNNNQCVGFNLVVSISGEVGEEASVTTSFVSSSFSENEYNVDPNATNDSAEKTMDIVIAPDISVATRLMTSGEIHQGSNVSYEVDFMNIGAGALYEATVGLFYVLPEGATFTGIEDLDPSDILSLTDPVNSCTSLGQVEDLGNAYLSYAGEVIRCDLISSTGNIPAGSSYPFTINMTASESFASGSTEVLGVALSLSGGEPDSADFLFAITRQQDAFSLATNNISHLIYDGNPLVVTVNPCAGQGAEVTVDLACFTVSFNKPVWGPTFTAEDIVFEGTGTLTNLVKDSSTQWTIYVSGMEPGETLRVLLNESGVWDYSAVSNGASVLGENVVRYALAGESSKQTNKSNGSGTSERATGNTSSGESAVVTAEDKPNARKKVGSGVVGFTQELVQKLGRSDLILGAWSVMQSNTLDLLIVVINVAGACALFFILRARRRRVS